ncbi:MAG: hypothetical protein ACK559_33715, partial [bacterium]
MPQPPAGEEGQQQHQEEAVEPVAEPRQREAEARDPRGPPVVAFAEAQQAEHGDGQPDQRDLREPPGRDLAEVQRQRGPGGPGRERGGRAAPEVQPERVEGQRVERDPGHVRPREPGGPAHEVAQAGRQQQLEAVVAVHAREPGAHREELLRVEARPLAREDALVELRMEVDRVGVVGVAVAGHPQAVAGEVFSRQQEHH